MLQNYLACGSNSSEAIDFFALNAYEWCGESTYTLSGYSTLNSYVENTGNGAYSVPIFFSETGCIVARPRTFADQGAILGSQMTSHWSGSIVYEWIEEANNYGLISYGPKVDPAASGAPPDGFTRSGTPTPIAPDFTNLQNQWKTLNPTGVKLASYTPTLTPPPCPSSTKGVWEVNGNPPLPTASSTNAPATTGGSRTGSGMIPPPDNNNGGGDGAISGSLGSSLFATSITSGAAMMTTKMSSMANESTLGSSDGTITASNNGSSDLPETIGSATSAAATPGAASPAKEIMGGMAGLAGLLIGALWFL